ncbi:MAG: TonB-dependent siderophore receptor [Thiotrichales bacterium]
MKRPIWHLTGASAIALLTGMSPVVAEEAKEDVVELEKYTTEDKVEDTMGLMPTEPVESVFGFGKTILETPRSVTSVTAETIERLGINDIDDLVLISPGAFTQSFFGVAGALDVRGTPGETYFRGIRRLDNPGNYPTPIGASDRIDIVRGPASPIYGPSKIGGYLNFVPKSARAETGQYLEENTGAITVETGSWDKNILSAEVGGPAKMFGKAAGYYVFFENENSGSYYDNTSTDQTIYQSSFNVDLTDKSRLEFGGMKHDYAGNQVAGWNRLTQELIDSGTYITGTAKPLDTNGDGSISHQEYGQANGGNGMDSFVFWGPPSAVTDADIPDIFNLDNPGTTKLKGNQVLVASDDVLENKDTVLYLDFIHDFSDTFSFTNKLYYETYDNLNENAYGFSQFHDTSVIENQMIFAFTKESEKLTSSFQISPSIRYTDFKHGDDYSNEFFDRRDLTGPSTALDRRLLATRIDDDYTEYYDGDYTDIGLAFLADLDFDFGLNVLAGVRQDSIDITSKTPLDKLLCPEIDDNGNFLSYSADQFSVGCADANLDASDTTDGTSWTVSLSYDTPIGLTPYVTQSEQFTIIAGQGGEVSTSSIDDGEYTDTSELSEAGVKGSLLDDTLYFSLSYYEQKRTDANAQAIVTNQTSKTTGTEFELRYLVNQNLALTAAYTQIEVINLNTEENGGRFSFFGADDLTSISDPALIYGGQFIGTVPNAPVDGANKAGIPKNSYALSATYDFLNGYATTVSYFHADETPSGHSRAVILPAYDLINAGVSYTKNNWSVGLMVKNLTDETYYRSNFPDLFGSQIVLPELPRHFLGNLTYKF